MQIRSGAFAQIDRIIRREPAGSLGQPARNRLWHFSNQLAIAAAHPHMISPRGFDFGPRGCDKIHRAGGAADVARSMAANG
jgi:hypothetical protein